MFQELMPLLAQRTLLLMISRVGADEIRINVIPQRLKSTNTDQNDALLTPLSISGTPKELDDALPAQLVEFVGTHLGLSSTLKTVKEQMDGAAKAARDAARKSTAGKAATSSAKPIPTPENVASEATARTTVPDPEPPSEQLSGSLFSDVPAGEP
jgi:PRTRC genetic system protein E